MHTIQAGYRGLWLLININWDRLFYLGTLLASLLAGAFLGTLVTGM